ncbi:MAG: DsrE/DsrF/DrsH-like family protein [Treponema sp.]|nr:DsrE/DsrF/DrsH-like family protein [Treponema sp.]
MARGLSCPGPIVKLGEALKETAAGDIIEISTTDPAFAGDIEGFCRRTGHVFGGMSSSRGVNVARITRAGLQETDRAGTSFVMVNAAAAIGRKVAMFFTFWGINILRRRDRARVKKDLVSRMFGRMMPKGSEKLGLSRMNMGGLEALIKSARDNGVELVACAMSMDVMGITAAELIPGGKNPAGRSPCWPSRRKAT